MSQNTQGWYKSLGPQEHQGVLQISKQLAQTQTRSVARENRFQSPNLGVIGAAGITTELAISAGKVWIKCRDAKNATPPFPTP